MAATSATRPVRLAVDGISLTVADPAAGERFMDRRDPAHLDQHHIATAARVGACDSCESRLLANYHRRSLLGGNQGAQAGGTSAAHGRGSWLMAAEHRLGLSV